MSVSPREMHLLSEAIEACDELYPSIVEITRRMLPTYPKHAGRRCEEIQEIKKTMLQSGSTPQITHAVREVTCDLATVPWTESNDRQQRTVEDIIEAIYQDTLQRAPGLNAE